MDPNQTQVNERYQAILIIWFGMLMSIVLFLILTLVKASDAEADNSVLTMALVGFSVMPPALSILVKHKLLAQAVEKQQLSLVQTAYVASFALCESSALLGLLDHFLTGSRSSYYYFAFGFAVLGMLLHFPRRDHLLAASYKKL